MSTMRAPQASDRPGSLTVMSYLLALKGSCAKLQSAPTASATYITQEIAVMPHVAGQQKMPIVCSKEHMQFADKLQLVRLAALRLAAHAANHYYR